MSERRGQIRRETKETRVEARLDLEGGPVALEVPGGFYLAPAYPNPFNPETVLTLVVSERQQIRVTVYDLLGRAVATLFDGPLAAETPHRLRFEAGALPSGLYLVRATGEAFSATQQVTLLK